jgi:hypothetical protein
MISFILIVNNMGIFNILFLLLFWLIYLNNLLKKYNNKQVIFIMEGEQDDSLNKIRKWVSG